MITVEEAQKLLVENIVSIEAVEMDARSVTGYVLAEDLACPIDLPPFDCTAMDGYAVRAADILKGEQNSLEVVGEIKAGDSGDQELRSGQALRIFTGAPIPPGADAIIIQEKVQVQESRIVLEQDEVPKGAHIRFHGEQIRTGALALEAGVEVTPGGAGFIAAMGIAKVKVHRKPEVSIVITGDELKNSGVQLERGQIYESNSATLMSALETIGIREAGIHTVSDDRIETERVLMEGLNSDILIISGGISVGDYDFVKEALEALGTQEVFYKVSQKPGKPLYFGRNGNTVVFALPGNPASALACFYEYCYPAARIMMGHKNPFLPKSTLPVLKEMKKGSARAQFFKAHVSDKGVTPLGGQESHMMQTFALSNALIYLPKEIEHVSVGDKVEVHMLP